MINKKSIWFLTLFSLILVLSIYYITMPNEILVNTLENPTQEVNNEISESTILVSLRVESDQEMMKEMETLQSVLTNESSTVEEKNSAFEEMQKLNNMRGKEEALEKEIKEKHNFDSFVKIKGNAIEIVINSKEHDSNLANSIIRTVQDNYETKMYITVKFAG